MTRFNGYFVVHNGESYKYLQIFPNADASLDSIFQPFKYVNLKGWGHLQLAISYCNEDGDITKSISLLHADCNDMAHVAEFIHSQNRAPSNIVFNIKCSDAWWDWFISIVEKQFEFLGRVDGEDDGT